MKWLLLRSLEFYKRFLSPALPHSCRYIPTCSEYAMEAVERYGVWRGVAMATWRVLRCNPFGGSGVDPVVRTTSFEEAEAHAVAHGHDHAALGSCGSITR